MIALLAGGLLGRIPMAGKGRGMQTAGLQMLKKRSFGKPSIAMQRQQLVLLLATFCSSVADYYYTDKESRADGTGHEVRRVHQNN